MNGIAIVLLALCVSVAGAQPNEGQRWGRSQLETVIIGKYSSELNLTPEQAEQFFPRFRQFQNRVEELQRRQMERRQELDMLARDPNANQRRVDQLLSQQTEHTQRIADMKQQFLTEVSGFLTPQQVSRCSILMDELPRRVHQYIEENRGSTPGYAPPSQKQRPQSRQETPRRRRTGY